MNTLFMVSLGAILVFVIPFLVRVVMGPTVFDRLIAFNAIGTKLPLLLMFIGFLYERPDMFVDIALGILLLNVYTTLLIARYIRKTSKKAQVQQ